VRIGIFGGAFDPPHIGHLFAAEQVREGYNLEKVVFLPSHLSDDKPAPSASSSDRVAMLNLSIYDNGYFDISEIDIKRGGYTYTYQSIRELRALYRGDRLYFITGYDAVIKINTWQNSEEIFEAAQVIGCNRNPKSEERCDKRIEIFPIPSIDISSTVCRERIKSSKSVKYMITEAVISYIKRLNLYR
jgi:nicotinate-nucleotide adenylyltransferase